MHWVFESLMLLLEASMKTKDAYVGTNNLDLVGEWRGWLDAVVSLLSMSINPLTHLYIYI